MATEHLYKQKRQLMGFSIHTLDSMESLINIPSDNINIGQIIRSKSNNTILINITGNNNLLADWHIVESNTDEILISTLRKVYNVDPSIELVTNIIGDVNKVSDDFLLLSRSNKHQCLQCGTTGSDKVFYLTEWEFSTGATTDGVIYCEPCVLTHITSHQ